MISVAIWNREDAGQSVHRSLCMFVRPMNRMHQEGLPWPVNRSRWFGEIAKLSDLPVAPAHDLVECIGSLGSAGLGMNNLAGGDVNAPVPTVSCDKVQGNGRAAQTFDLNDVE